MRLNYISILRSLSIIFVVFFHVYGYFYADHIPGIAEDYKNTYFWIIQCVIINVAMPMFTFISGYLFEYLFKNKGKYRDFLSFIKNKVKRLLLPYLIFGIIFMITTNDFRPYDLIFKGAYWHLWYLPRLFWCFICAWMLNKWIKNHIVRLILLPILLFYPLAQLHIPPFIGMQETSNWFCWFYMGMIYWDYKETIINTLKRFYISGILLLTIYLFQIWFFPVEYGERTWLSIFSTCAIVTLLYYLFHQIQNTNNLISRSLISLSKYSFGIYIFHNWIGVYLISSTAQKLFNLPELAANHLYLFPLCIAILDLIICIGLSWLMLKTKIGRALIG